MKVFLFSLTWICLTLGNTTFADNLSGIWKNIDDKTGSIKAVIEIHQEQDNTYTGKITKITPRPDYTPQETCVNCPGVFKNRPILGMNILSGLKNIGKNQYSHGKLIDPLSGNIYNTKAKLSSNGQLLMLRGYIGVSVLGRSQTWIKVN